MYFTCYSEDYYLNKINNTLITKPNTSLYDGDFKKFKQEYKDYINRQENYHTIKQLFPETCRSLTQAKNLCKSGNIVHIKRMYCMNPNKLMSDLDDISCDWDITSKITNISYNQFKKKYCQFICIEYRYYDKSIMWYDGYTSTARLNYDEPVFPVSKTDRDKSIIEYKAGDLIKFRFGICGIVTGIIETAYDWYMLNDGTNFPDNAIIVNVRGKIKINKKRFNGLNINSYEIDFRDYIKVHHDDILEVYGNDINKIINKMQNVSDGYLEYLQNLI